MENIKKIILSTVPEAVIEEKQKLTVTVEPDKLHQLAKELKENKESNFDFLAQLLGVDYGDKLGVVYFLSSTEDMTREVVLKTATSDKVNPLLDSVTDLWGTANFNEREVYAMFGIRFVNNPDMRKFFLNQDWDGYPLRKDYDSNPVLNPVDIESKPIIDQSLRITRDADGNIKEEKYCLFEPDDYIINIGPQHPSTHGVMHFRTVLDGEIIKNMDVISGYIHRGIEKLSENLTYPQILHFTDRLDYLSAQINRHALCMCIEKAAEIEVPLRAEHIRVIMDELQRIASHLVAWAAMCNDMGSTTAFIYGFREREYILDIFEKSSGVRFLPNYNVIGGVMFDVYDDFEKDVKAFIPIMRKALKEYERLFTHNVIALGRMKGVGILPKDEAISYGVTGVVGRGSGINVDMRRDCPYSIYDKVEFNVIVRDECDSYARYLNRLDEMEESLKIIEQLLPLPEGDFQAKTKAIIKLPEGEFWQRVETGRGEFGVFIESHGDKTPYRLHFRSPSMTMVEVMPLISKGEKVSDFIAIGGSMDYVIPDIDR